MAIAQTGWFDHTALDKAKKRKTTQKVHENDVQHTKMIAQQTRQNRTKLK